LFIQVAIPESIAVANEKGMDEAIVLLLALEKKCRLANDSTNLKEVCLHMVRLCRERSDWVKLNSVLAVINKRDSQNKTIIIAVTKEVLTYIDTTPTNDVKIELIKALKEVVDGKIYVEGESASLHFMLSKIYESQGDIDAACDIIQDVHVETYGSLTKQQKAEYILEQMRVTLVKKDYVRAMIHSRKMNPKTLEEEGFADIKIRYYTMMVAYHAVDRNSWEVCQAYYKVSGLGHMCSACLAIGAPRAELSVPDGFCCAVKLTGAHAHALCSFLL
jgi:26S proteasome regulatory subunit N5